MKALFLLIGLCLVLGACDRSPASPVADDSASSALPSPSDTGPSSSPVSPSASPTAAPSPSPTPSGQVCPNQASVVSDPSLLRPGLLRGDLDGDGRQDTVRVALDPAADPGCQAFLIERLHGRRVAAPIREWEPSLLLAAPHLNSLGDIDAAPGDDVVVDVNAGASTQFEGVYSYSSGGIVAVGLKGFPFNGLYAYGGSVGHLDGQACTPGHRVVISSAVPKGASGTRYKVVRRFFRAQIGVLEYMPGRTRRQLRSAAALSRLPEFSGSPFARCAPA